jgi:SAM-dependent methyltransferase
LSSFRNTVVSFAAALVGGRQRLTRLRSFVESLWEFVRLPQDDRRRILAADPSRFTVGGLNEPTREAWIKKVLAELPPGAFLLDAGAGECIYKKYCSHLRYVSQDLAKYDGTGAVGLQTGSWDTSQIDIVSDITNIPVPDASFDALLCTEVLEHVSDPVAALKELKRIVKPGGTLIVTAPFCSMTHFAPYHHATGFSRYFYECHLQGGDFDIVELVQNGNFFEFVAQDLRSVDVFARRYAGESCTRLERLAGQIVLRMLERMSKRDEGSRELLNFGIFVRAVKRHDPHQAVQQVGSTATDRVGSRPNNAFDAPRH